MDTIKINKLSFCSDWMRDMATQGEHIGPPMAFMHIIDTFTFFVFRREHSFIGLKLIFVQQTFFTSDGNVLNQFGQGVHWNTFYIQYKDCWWNILLGVDMKSAYGIFFF